MDVGIADRAGEPSHGADGLSNAAPLLGVAVSAEGAQGDVALARGNAESMNGFGGVLVGLEFARGGARIGRGGLRGVAVKGSGDAPHGFAQLPQALREHPLGNQGHRLPGSQLQPGLLHGPLYGTGGGREPPFPFWR